MSASSAAGAAAVGVVCLITIAVSVYSLRLSRTTGDFYVASRRVPPWLNASAVAGEYLSAASFLGVAGLILACGTQGLWYPVGYTAGFFTLLLFVAAPLRRSGAYTLPDFMALRFRSVQMRRLAAFTVVVTGWLYIIPQLHGASLTLSATAGLPGWLGPVLVVLVILPTVLSSGMRSVTITQAVQYWIKLSALLIPAVFIALHFGMADAAAGAMPDFNDIWSAGLTPDGGGELYATASLVLALMLGTIGLPHVLVRFYTNPDGTSARRTTVLLLAMLAGFYLLPVGLGVVSRAVLAPPAVSESPDEALLRLPGAVFEGITGDLLTALVVGGAFAAFLSTASGLVVSVAGVMSQEFFGGTVRGFRISAMIAVGLPLLIGTLSSQLALAGAVAMVFSFAAASFAPVLLLGIWWSRLTVRGAAAGMLTGAAGTLLALFLGLGVQEAGTDLEMLLYPAMWCVPLAFTVTVLVSRWDPQPPPASTASVMARLHTPEQRRGARGERTGERRTGE